MQRHITSASCRDLGQPSPNSVVSDLSSISYCHRNREKSGTQNPPQGRTRTPPTSASLFRSISSASVAFVQQTARPPPGSFRHIQLLAQHLPNPRLQLKSGTPAIIHRLPPLPGSASHESESADRPRCTGRREKTEVRAQQPSTFCTRLLPQEVHSRWSTPIDVDSASRTLPCHCIPCKAISAPTCALEPFELVDLQLCCTQQHPAVDPRRPAPASFVRHIETRHCIRACTDLLHRHGNVLAAGCNAAGAALLLWAVQPLRSAPRAQPSRQGPVHLPAPKA